MPPTELTPATAAELARMVAENFHRPRRPLSAVGGRTALHYGYPIPPETTPVVMTGLNRVLDYPCRDMTITVEAGIRVKDLQLQLAAENQCLPVDIPQAHRATIGGAVATNPSGPGRYGYGTLRDYVIGISAVDGRGRLFSAGGRVVKNVAGYDLCKLLIGSLGTLAIITQVTIKLRPVPETGAVLWSAFNGPDEVEPVLEAINLSETRPVVLDVLNPKSIRQLRSEARQDLPDDCFAVCIGFDGSERETAWQIETAARELEPHRPGKSIVIRDEEAVHLRQALTDYQTASDDPLTFQASLPPSRTMEFMALAGTLQIAVQAHAGNGVVVGHLPDRCTDAASAARILEPLRRFAAGRGGALTVLNCDEDWKKTVSLFGPEPPAWTLMRGIKQALDPAGVLNPQRLFSP